MARLVYACRVDVAGPDAIGSVLSIYKEWIISHYRNRRELTDFDFDPKIPGNHDVPEGHSLSSSLYQDGDECAVIIHWSYPDSNNFGLKWENLTRIGQFYNSCGVEHLTYIESIEYNLSPARFNFGSPRAIREVCAKLETFVGEMNITSSVYTVDKNQLADLMTLLTSDIRRIPLILMTPYADGQQNLIDSTDLSQRLAGVAIVIRVDDPELTWDFSDEVGRALSCFNGAARIYWPGFSKESDPGSHRLFLGSWIQTVGAGAAVQAIERVIFAVATLRYLPDPRITELVRRVESAQRRQILIARKQTSDDFFLEYENDLIRLDEANARITELESENANLKANLNLFFVPENMNAEALAPAEEVESFTSVITAVNAAEARCKNLVILETAKSAARDSPFQRPQEIYQALKDLDEIVDDWSKSQKERGNGGDILRHLRSRGWGKRSSMHISDTTRSKYRSDYEFIYEGIPQLFEPHITIGAGDANSCASIHFIFDQQKLKMVIAHVGKHLPNTKT